MMKRWLVLLSLCVALMAVPVMAQESTETEAPAVAEEAGAPGVTIFVLLAGLLAVVGVGGVVYMRERANQEVD
jgi:hypothetical protein